MLSFYFLFGVLLVWFFVRSEMCSVLGAAVDSFVLDDVTCLKYSLACSDFVAIRTVFYCEFKGFVSFTTFRSKS